MKDIQNASLQYSASESRMLRRESAPPLIPSLSLGNMRKEEGPVSSVYTETPRPGVNMKSEKPLDEPSQFIPREPSGEVRAFFRGTENKMNMVSNSQPDLSSITINGRRGYHFIIDLLLTN
jgi:hypothetical protein